MSICQWPAEERPREKLLPRGATSLSDAELLAIFLRTGRAGMSAVDLARDLLHEYGNLRSLLNANQQDFCRGLGLGSAKYAQLQAVLEMSRRHLAEQIKRDIQFDGSSAVKRYLLAQLKHRQVEVFAALFLNKRHQLIQFDELFHGTLDSATVYPREVVKRALSHNAAAVIFTHNHPSGCPKPSRADRHITEHLKKALSLIEVATLDHIIIGDGEVYSFAENGEL